MSQSTTSSGAVVSASPNRQTCRHFNGTGCGTCQIGVPYDAVKVLHTPEQQREFRRSFSIPCRVRMNYLGAACAQFEAFTVEELAAQEAETQRLLDCLNREISPCCEAPFNTSQVIQAGRHKGHSPRFCSKCGKHLFQV